MCPLSQNQLRNRNTNWFLLHKAGEKSKLEWYLWGAFGGYSTINYEIWFKIHREYFPYITRGYSTACLQRKLFEKRNKYVIAPPWECPIRLPKLKKQHHYIGHHMTCSVFKSDAMIWRFQKDGDQQNLKPIMNQWLSLNAKFTEFILKIKIYSHFSYIWVVSGVSACYGVDSCCSLKCCQHQNVML